jgi:LEA14-like dessication related protein
MKNTILAFGVLFILSLSSCEVDEISFVQLDDVKITKIEQKEVFLDVSVQLENPNSFDVKVKDSDLDLYLEGTFIGKARLDNAFTIKKGGTHTYDLNIVAEGENMNVKLLPIMMTAALSGQVKTELKGTITGKVAFISKTVPFNVTETVKLTNDAQ